MELVLVDRAARAQKFPDYLRLNPNGRIPTLVCGDLVMFEAAAICVHVAEQHPEARLIPPLGALQRAHFFQWLMFAPAACASPVWCAAFRALPRPSLPACL
ncbi:MAG: glutathione S-transferase N-terminal domain-containing protein [Deltaproteobacteria bacterium]